MVVKFVSSSKISPRSGGLVRPSEENVRLGRISIGAGRFGQTFPRIGGISFARAGVVAGSSATRDTLCGIRRIKRDLSKVLWTRAGPVKVYYKVQVGLVRFLTATSRLGQTFCRNRWD